MENKFANILKSLRTENNLSQDELAKELNYTQSNISEWEKGSVEPKAAALLKISDYFQVSTDYLLGRTQEFNDFVISKEDFALSYEEKVLITDYRSFGPQFKKIVKDTVKALKNSNGRSI